VTYILYYYIYSLFARSANRFYAIVWADQHIHMANGYVTIEPIAKVVRLTQYRQYRLIRSNRVIVTAAAVAIRKHHTRIFSYKLHNIRVLTSHSRLFYILFYDKPRRCNKEWFGREKNIARTSRPQSRSCKEKSVKTANDSSIGRHVSTGIIMNAFKGTT